MAKDKTAKLERAKKATKAKKASSYRVVPPRGWIQGDWLPPTTTAEDISGLVVDGLVRNGSWRLPEEGEIEPAPCPGERVLLTTHVERGFSMPPHPFLRDFLNFFGAQLHHLPPNAIAYLATFVSMCENFLGCQPHWGLFKHIFTCHSQSVKKADPEGERTHVTQMCGGLGIQMRGRSAFPTMIFP